MSLQDIVNSVLGDTSSSLAAFRPELVLCATIVLILLLRIVRLTARVDSFYLTLLGAAVGLWFAIQDQRLAAETAQPIFTGMLAYDSLTAYFRTVLLLFAVLFAVFTRISGIPDRDAAPDVYPLVLGATLGMCLMASANHMLIVFLGVEMASVPSYALAGMLKGRRKSSEAALKYAVYGAGAAGVMLYGISLLAGVLGSVHIPTMTLQLADLLQPVHVAETAASGKLMVLALGGLMIMVGLAFKLSAVPFHFWCPDVFEGATAEVNAFLSVASKAAALALLVRVAVGFSSLPHLAEHLAERPAAERQVASAGVFSVSDAAEPSADEVAPQQLASDEPSSGPSSAPAEPSAAPLDRAAQIQALQPVRDFTSKLLAIVAVITCTFGNLAAYGQRNIKRLLAYSTIAHAGYMIMPVAAAVVLSGTDPAAAEAALGALAVYVAIYLFMNLGAFAIVAFLRNAMRSEEIADYAGLIRRAPVVTVCFAFILFSLIGLPPLAGFTGKFLIFTALVKANLWTVFVIAGLNTALSLFYYLRVVKIMTIDPEPQTRLPFSIAIIPGTFIAAITLPVVVLGVWWDGLNQWALAAARHLLS